MVQVLIRSGGQTGVDRAAIEFALQHNLPSCGLLELDPNLIENPLTKLLQRTA